MSMHMIRGVRTGGSKKKINKKPGHDARLKEHNDFLRSMGIDPDMKPSTKSKGINKIPDYNTRDIGVKCSNKVATSGNKKETIMYTGNELAGVALMHKQAYEPIRKDNKQAAIESSQMRRS